MALPSPDDLAAIVKPTIDTAEEFLAKLATDMGDPTKVKNGFRTNGSFSFYIPGTIRGFTFDEIKKAITTAGFTPVAVQQVHGYMPSNEMIDFLNADPSTPDVTGPSTFAWVHINIKRAPVKQ